MNTEPNELDQLRIDLTDRLEKHPPSTWPGDLLRVVASAIDLQFGRSGFPPGPVLCVVRPGW